MKRFSRWATLMLALTLACTMLAGCGKTPEKTNVDAVIDDSSNPFKDPIEISIALWDIDKSFPQGANDPIYDQIKKDLNITIVPKAVGWGDYGNKLNVWAASSQLPDVFATDNIGKQTYQQWIKQGVVKALPDDLSKYPYLFKAVSGPDIDAWKVDNKMWFLPRVSYTEGSGWAGDRGILVRKDWMDKLGLKEPKNEQDFLALVKAFATQDPDGNGQNDTIGVTAQNLGFLWYAGINYLPNTNWQKEDGKWVPSQVTKGNFELLKFYKRLYQSGGLDKDIAILKNDDAINKFASGKVGALVNQVTAKHVKKVYDAWQKIQPEKDFYNSIKILNMWPGSDGNSYRFILSKFWSESYINAKVDDKKMSRILSLYDYLLSDKGGKLLRYGIDGTDYKTGSDGTIQILLDKNSDGSYKTPGDKYPFPYAMSYLAQWDDNYQYDNTSIPEKLRKITKEHLDWELKNSKAPEINWNIQAMSTPTKDTLVLGDGSDVTNFMMSKNSDDTDWKALMDKYNKLGVNKAIEEVNKKAVEMGIK